MSGSEWDPVHHEDFDEPDQKPTSPEKADKATKAAAKSDQEKGGPALILTIPPNMIAGLWSLSEAIEENTKATRELIKELRAARGE